MFLFNKSEKNDSPAPIQNKPVSQPTQMTFSRIWEEKKLPQKPSMKSNHLK